MTTRKLSRRRFLKAVGLTAAGWATRDVLLSGQTAEPQTKWNVLFIAVDDLRPQLGCYGAEQIHSPHIDRLAKEGLLFERTYCQQALSAPSRASILSGVRPDTSKIYNLTTPLRTALPEVLTLPEHFKQNGYVTVSVGKIYHHAKDDRRGWSVEPYRAAGDWQGRGYLTAEAIAQMKDLDRKNENSAGIGPAWEAAEVADEAYPDGKDTDYAIEQIRKYQNRPFFLAMGFHKPHLPFNAPKRYWDRYPPESIRLADNPFLPQGVPSYAVTNWSELRSYAGIPQRGPCPDELARRLIRGYYACVSYVDAQIGRLLDELERLELRQRTVVVLWGDHGWKLGEHGLWSKHTNFELDTHVPLILSVPGMAAAGRRTAGLTEFVDIYPTLCQACGLQTPGHLEGLSFLPLTVDPDRPWKQAAFSQYPRGRIMGYSLRSRRYRYTEWQDRSSREVLARELYDHQDDPGENRNCARLPEYADTVKQLSEQLRRGWQGALPASAPSG
ncbi:MAG: sulfatase [Sedimentisphaerales bacterium]|nr:sulfatase [Sedimentisphaerales bacterium]